MNKSLYFLGALAFVALIYNNYTTSTKSSSILFETKNNQQYTTAVHEYKGDFVGSYKATTIEGDKELILDSTYTYSCIVDISNKEVCLEGTWELSYKDSSQHIILSPPTLKNTAQNLEELTKVNINFEEQKLKVTKYGDLISLIKKEAFIKQTIENQALVVQE